MDGKIIAPTSPSAWGSGTLQWLEFTKLSKIAIKGKGVIDGQGSVWWSGNGKLPGTKPTVRIFTLNFSQKYKKFLNLSTMDHEKLHSQIKMVSLQINFNT